MVPYSTSAVMVLVWQM